jgi:hypothetical protein
VVERGELHHSAGDIDAAFPKPGLCDGEDMEQHLRKRAKVQLTPEEVLAGRDKAIRSVKLIYPWPAGADDPIIQ